MTDGTGTDRIVRATWAGTAVLGVTAVLAVAWPDTLAVPYAVVSILLFLGGCSAFVWGYLVAVGRSRDEELSVAGIWMLSGSTPAPVRRHLLGALLLQVAIVVVAAAVRPFTAVAFGVLAPLYGLGLAGLWAARHGTFPARDDPRGRRSAA
jgi:hypothetical protein